MKKQWNVGSTNIKINMLLQVSFYVYTWLYCAKLFEVCFFHSLFSQWTLRYMKFTYPVDPLYFIFSQMSSGRSAA